MPKRRRGEKKTTYFDYNLLFIIIFLLCFGLVMLYSSSSYTSANKYGDSAHYLKLQARNIAIGLVFMFYFAKKDYHVWRKFGRLAYWGALGFCFVVLAKVPGLTRSSHGQSRWIQVGPIGFQPSELAKIAIIIYLAMLIERIPKQLDKVSSMAKVGIRLVPLVVFVAVNNLSTAIIILGWGCCLFSHLSISRLTGVTVWRHGNIRRQREIRDIRPCRHSMQSDPASCLEKDSDRACRSLAMCRRHRMI